MMFDSSGDNYLTVAPGANYRITPERVCAAETVIAASDWIVIQQEIPMESNRAVLEVAAKHGCPVMLNYAPAHDLTLEPDATVHALIVNELEAAALAGSPLDPEDRASAVRMAAELRERGAHALVVITLFVPCVASIMVMAKEHGSRTAVRIWLGTWIVAFIIGGALAQFLHLFGAV